MPLRICFIGDSITVGTGDEAFLGWPGRLCSAARSQGYDLTLYNLGIRGETSEDIRRRWREEAERRLPAHMNCALVFAFGINDCAVENGIKLRVELERTAINARAILDEAKAWLPSIFVGPTPVDDSRLPPQLMPGKEIRIFNAQIAEANQALAGVMGEVGVSYLDLFTPLVSSPEWQRMMKLGDGIHPTCAGYEMMTQKVQDWEGWRSFLARSR